MDMRENKTLKKYIRSLKYNIGSTEWIKNCPDQKADWLNYICSNRYNEKQVLEFIQLLLEKTDIDINQVDNDGYNFIQNALYSNYSEDFMMQLFDIAYHYGNFDINYHGDAYGDTVMHTAIESDNYIGKIAPLMRIANKMGFDPSIKNDDNKTVLDVSLNPDCNYELDEEDLLEVKNLIKLQQEKIRLEKSKEKLLLIQKQLENILEPLDEEERQQVLEATYKVYSYKKTR